MWGKTPRGTNKMLTISFESKVQFLWNWRKKKKRKKKKKEVFYELKKGYWNMELN